jgi:hypothetical protein
MSKKYSIMILGTYHGIDAWKKLVIIVWSPRCRARARRLHDNIDKSQAELVIYAIDNSVGYKFKFDPAAEENSFAAEVEHTMALVDDAPGLIKKLIAHVVFPVVLHE